MDEKMITIWSDPRWRVLFDVTRLNRVKPWEIKLADIVRALMTELARLGIIDLNTCGVAAYSAATIHRMKAERLLKADLPSPPKEKPQLLVPPPIELPLTPEFMATTIEELVRALQAAVSRKRNGGDGLTRVEAGFPEVRLDDFLLKLEEKVEEFIRILEEIFSERDLLDFSEILKGVDRVEAARRFILLLFAAAQGVVELSQDEETGRIVVKWLGGFQGD